jgi:biotin synthase
MSVGNRSKNVYEGWKNNGMDGYLIRFETSDPTLFSKIHPDSLLQDRLDCIRALKELGLKIASGFMIGVPGESLETLSRNILLCKELTLDIVGCGPFIPHPQTAMAQDFNAYRGREEIFLQTIAALRVLNPDADILATPTFDIVMPPDGRKHALQSGANVCPVSKTPEELSEKYDIYPKAITDPEPFESVVRNVKMEERLKRKPTDHIPKNG